MSSKKDTNSSSDSLSSKDTQLLFGGWFILTLFGLVLLGQVLPENTPRWLSVVDALGIITGTITSVFVIVSASFMYARRDELINTFKNRLARPEFYNTGHPFEEKVEAVVMPVSNTITNQPEWIIRNLKPKYVALLCSNESCANGVKLMKDESLICEFVNDLSDLKSTEGKVISNPRDPEAAKNLTRSFISELVRRGVPRTKIFVDTTAGLVPMSIGAFQGAEEEGVSTIYINGTHGPRCLIEDPYDSTHGEPIFMSDRTSDAQST
jgi:hypothetical protein